MKRKRLWYMVINGGMVNIERIILHVIDEKLGFIGDGEQSTLCKHVGYIRYSLNPEEYNNVFFAIDDTGIPFAFSQSKSRVLNVMSDYINDKLSQLSIETADYFKYLSDVKRLKGEGK